MKKSLLLGLIIMASFSAHAELESTTIFVNQKPTEKMLKVAIEILEEAIDAKKEGNEPLAMKKIKKAQKYQQYFRGPKKFDTAFLVKNKYSSTFNYFEVNDDDFEELKYEVEIDKTCYVGNIYTANKLLKTIINTTDKLLYSEEWYDNSRVENGKLLIDYVDGPGEATDEREINKCK